MGVVWKVIDCVLNKQFFRIPLHGTLCGFRFKRGCEAGITEAKLVQQLAFLKQMPHYGIFLDIHKDHDAMDRDRCLQITRESK